MQVLRVDSEDCGTLGIIPTFYLDSPKPKFRNNGYNCFSGQPNLTLPELLSKSQHIVLHYSCGGRFETYASSLGDDLFSFG